MLSVAVLLVGHGMQLTLLPLTAQALGWPSALIGLTGSAYYVGFIVGCLSVAGIVRRVGYIRTFSVSVALATMALVLAELATNFPAWLLLRFTTGLCMAALYTVVESWLNERTADGNRGSILALYMALSLGAMAVGQLFIEAGMPRLEHLFPIATVLLIAATLPIGLTVQPQPDPPSDIQLRWRVAYDASNVGVVCAGLSGVVVGLLWSMGAVYASAAVGSSEAGARFVLFALIGGLAAQFPAGRLSDFLDRRIVIVGLALIGTAGAGLPLLVTELDGVTLYLAAFLCGAGAMPMYSVCVAHANDNAQGNFLAIASSMLIANALGAIAGPAVYAAVAALPYGFMLTMLLAFTCCVAWTLLRIGQHSVSRDHFERYQPLPENDSRGDCAGSTNAEQ